MASKTLEGANLGISMKIGVRTIENTAKNGTEFEAFDDVFTMDET